MANVIKNPFFNPSMHCKKFIVRNDYGAKYGSKFKSSCYICFQKGDLLSALSNQNYDTRYTKEWWGLVIRPAESLEFTWKMPEGTEALYNEGFVQPVIDTFQSQATKVCLVIVWLSVPLIIVLSFSHNPCVACNQTLPHAILDLGKRLEGFCS